MTFRELNLSEEILKAIEEAGYETPTPIQLKAIPKIMRGFDLRASAQTGTGKTAAFILPALDRMLTSSKLPGIGPRVLILVPTRELALQVAAESTKYSKNLSRMKTICIYGGAPYPPQNRDLSRPHEILVATPGRLIDHMKRGKVNFSRVEMFILDEADRMLDMGFIDPVEEIASAIPKIRQTLMFSATLNGNVMDLSENLLNKPMEIRIASDQTKHENIEQQLYHVDDMEHKFRLLEHMLREDSLKQTIVFISTKHQADKVAERLQKNGHGAAALHGDMNQRQRTRTLNQVREGKIKALIATDIAARGIDVATISHVINFDLPRNTEDYVHRIGRTGRASAKGIALSFISGKDIPLLKKIEQFIGQKIASHHIPGHEPRSKHHHHAAHPAQPKPKKNKKSTWQPYRRKTSKW